MKKMTIAAACAVLAAGSAWAGPLAKEQVSASARWVVHVDVTAMLASPIGQWALGKMREHGGDKKLEAFREKFGFDPIKDLRSVTLYGESCERGDGVAIVQAKADKNTLLRRLTENKGHTEQAWGAYVIHTWTQKPMGPGDDGQRFGLFYRDDVVVMAPTAAKLKAAVDVLNGKSANLVKAGSALVPEAPAGTFFLAAGANLVMPAKAGRHGMMLKAISGGWLAMGQDGDTLFTKCDMTARSEKDATRLRTVIQGLLAMAELASEPAATPSPAGTTARPCKPDFSVLLKGIRVASAGLTVHVESTATMKEFTGFLEAAGKAHKAMLEARKAREARAKAPEACSPGAKGQPAKCSK